MTIATTAVFLSAAMITLSLGAVSWRLIRGPSLSDRVIALDMLGLIAIVVAALTAAVTRHQSFLDVAFGFALLGFMTAVAFAGLLERTRLHENVAPNEGSA